MTVLNKSISIDGLNFGIETGKIAKQAGGSTVVRLGDTMVLTTVCDGPAREGCDFFPLTVEYREMAYAAGKIPGGFFKREAKPSTDEILSARVIDRPIRPLFPEGYCDEVQVVSTVISADKENKADVLAVTGASMSLCLSGMPFYEPVAAVRVSTVDGKFKVFPTIEEFEAGEMELVVAGTMDSIMMVEGGAYEIPEDRLVDAILFAHEHIKSICQLQKDIMNEVGVVPVEYVAPEGRDSAIDEAVKEIVGDRLHQYSFCGQKEERYGKLAELKSEVVAALEERFPDQISDIKDAFSELEFHDMRNTIIKEGKRIGGRGLDEVRKITCELDYLPRAHGSAVFTRGETQALVTATLGTKKDEMIIDNIQKDYRKTYYLHYNFPPYSVGEVKRMGVTSRREIGHGHLAERSLAPVLPAEAAFPYTIRIVSDITESNGSSSMASVCGGTLALMAAGVPIKSPVAGVAMGLIAEGDEVAILTDILGTEDHLGDMDFKVTGTRDGITAIQMDIKIKGITPELMKESLGKARNGRMHILDEMAKTISESRKSVGQFAPAIISIKVKEDKIGAIIGPGGKVIKEMQERTKATINIDDDGTVTIAGENLSSAEAARDIILGIIEEPEIGKVYTAKVKKVVDFGAFCEYLPGKEGLLHVSELANKRVENVEEFVKEGDVIDIKLVGIERNGKVRLSLKAMTEAAASEE